MGTLRDQAGDTLRIPRVAITLAGLAATASGSLATTASCNLAAIASGNLAVTT